MSDSCVCHIVFQIKDTASMVHYISGREGRVRIFPHGGSASAVKSAIKFELSGFFDDVVWIDDDIDRGLDDVVECTNYEAKYGYCDELNRASGAGLTFFGSHTAGGDYEEAVFASFAYEIEWPSSLFGTPVIPVGPDLKISEDGLEAIGHYYCLYREARGAMGFETSVEPKPRKPSRGRIIRV